MELHINIAVLLDEWTKRYGITGPVLGLGMGQPAFSKLELATVRASGSNDNAADAGDAYTAEGLVDELFGAGTQLRRMETPAPQRWSVQGATADALAGIEPSAFGLVIDLLDLGRHFDCTSALNTIRHAVAEGGYIFHLVPCNNFAGDGYWQLSPRTLRDYYLGQSFDILESALVEFDPAIDDGHRWRLRALSDAEICGSAQLVTGQARMMYALLARAGAVKHEPASAGRMAMSRWFPTFELFYGVRTVEPRLLVVPLTAPAHRDGHSWQAQTNELNRFADTMTNPLRSRVVLLENDVALGPPHTEHQAITEVGAGAFSHWGDKIVFSSSDNTSPAENGRTYVAVLPWRGEIP
ncbi:MAG: hypothetical protein H6978_03910 [Gammaproteobacteria bacterium]|nr:hypothetical protein [Gammaproteobacteria bacterium]